MTLLDVAAYIGMSRRWVAERVRRREIPCYRFGTALRFDQEEVRQWTERYWSAPEGRGRDPERVRR
jgi:excisionase family DNA binding protein